MLVFDRPGSVACKFSTVMYISQTFESFVSCHLQWGRMSSDNNQRRFMCTNFNVLRILSKYRNLETLDVVLFKTELLCSAKANAHIHVHLCTIVLSSLTF